MPTPDPVLSSALTQRAQGIRLLALDVDGVLTQGEILYTSTGEELKAFNVKDGHGIALALHYGIQVALITGRKSPIISRRAQELGIRYVFEGIKQKTPVLQALVQTVQCSLQHVAYMGDDTPDMGPLQLVGLASCPADAIEPVQQLCHYVSSRPGGQGAVRQLIDIILNAQGIQPGAIQTAGPC